MVIGFLVGNLFVKSLVNRCFGQTNQRQRRQPIGQMRFDRNGRRLDAHLGAAVNNRQSHDSFLEFAKKPWCANLKPGAGMEWIRDVNGYGSTANELPKCGGEKIIRPYD